MGLRRLFLLFSTVIAMLFIAATPASAADPVSGPAAAQVLETYLYPDGLINKPAALRAGNSRFGAQHIAIGGSRRDTTNHELTPQAKALWSAALAEGPKAAAFFGGKLFTRRYFENSGVRTYVKTMCVVVSELNYTFAGVNYGAKGIITAYWVRGDAGPTGAGCTDD